MNYKTLKMGHRYIVRHTSRNLKFKTSNRRPNYSTM